MTTTPRPSTATDTATALAPAHDAAPTVPDEATGRTPRVPRASPAPASHSAPEARPSSGAVASAPGTPPSAPSDVETAAAPSRAAFRAVRCGDGLDRCPWAPATPGALADHDLDWGARPTSAHGYFAALTLELVDSGLARWSQSARHDAWFLHMAGLDPARVALLDDDDVDDLLDVPELIRNRSKIEAVVRNARACEDWEVADWETLLTDAEVPPPGPPPETSRDLPDSTEASRRLALVLRASGFGLVGPVTAHRWLQRIGRAPGHVRGCFRQAPDPELTS